ncbi:hypothetical protein Slin14017_G000750 [Septoria linicola]|nr:hypothetical protein Slin14017_G000750 [Septoria linicola]
MDRTNDEVLLVLTGCYEGIKTDREAIALEAWKKQIVARPSHNSFRIQLKDAIEFMHTLDRREQAANPDLARLNELRRQGLEDRFSGLARSFVKQVDAWGLNGITPKERAVLEGTDKQSRG